MLWFDCWTTGSRHCSNSFTSSHNIQTSSFAINQFSLIHSFHFTKKGVTYTCFLARWVDKEIEMLAACFTAQLGGEAFLQRDLAPICSGQWGVCSIAPNFGKNLESYNCSIASFIQMFQSMHWGVDTSIFNGISLRPLSYHNCLLLMSSPFYIGMPCTWCALQVDKRSVWCALYTAMMCSLARCSVLAAAAV